MLHKWIWIKASENYFKSVSDFWAIGKKLAHDLALACKLDYDEDASAMLKEVQSRWKKEGRKVITWYSWLCYLTLGSKFTADAKKQPLEVTVCNHQICVEFRILIEFHALISHSVIFIAGSVCRPAVVNQKIRMVKGDIFNFLWGENRKI